MGVLRDEWGLEFGIFESRVGVGRGWVTILSCVHAMSLKPGRGGRGGDSGNWGMGVGVDVSGGDSWSWCGRVGSGRCLGEIRELGREGGEWNSSPGNLWNWVRGGGLGGVSGRFLELDAGELAGGCLPLGLLRGRIIRPEAESGVGGVPSPGSVGDPAAPHGTSGPSG